MNFNVRSGDENGDGDGKGRRGNGVGIGGGEYWWASG